MRPQCALRGGVRDRLRRLREFRAGGEGKTSVLGAQGEEKEEGRRQGSQTPDDPKGVGGFRKWKQ